MKQVRIIGIVYILFLVQLGFSQNVIPLDTTNWKINKQAAYLFENYKGKKAIYLSRGRLTYRGAPFKNGTIEFDLFLKKEQAFPGVFFRAVEADGEEFYLRPQLSGKPDANQAAPVTNGITPWQLYFGPKYSFAYDYKYDDWTHVKLVVKDDKAQIYLDYSEKPHLSWNLFHPTRVGGINFRGGMRSGIHIADIKINTETPILRDFVPVKRDSIDGLIPEWEISDMFEKERLSDPTKLSEVINQRKWGRVIQVEEGIAANISRQQILQNNKPEETVFARINIKSDQDQIKLFQFGYSDDVVAILNGKAIYKGSNQYKSRDYRYLGTIGLYDGIYLNLKKGNNTLLMAVSENFGGWLITGKFEDVDGIEVSIEK